MIARFLILTVSLSTTVATASTPTGQHFGAWHVVSISSLSGTQGDDASALMVQKQNCQPDGSMCSELGVDWTQGSDVIVSIEIQDCRGDDEDFQQNYAIPLKSWFGAGRDIERRIERDFTTWLEQAALACEEPNRWKAFELAKVRPAVRDFTRRLTWFAQ